MLMNSHSQRFFSSFFSGKGGRHSNADRTIAIFGATGFLGRYVVNALGRSGWTIHIACRGDDMEWRHLKPLVDYGKLVPHYYSAKDEASIEGCIPKGQVDVVLNLIGKRYETRHILPWIINNTYEDTHIKATSAIAKVARRNGVKHFVQMSCAKAALDSTSVWAKTKAVGELEAAKQFPGATIVRAGQVYGPEDTFLNPIAQMVIKDNIFRLIDEGKAKVSPVYVVNVAEALVPILYNHEDFAGETVHLLGKDEYTMKQIVEFVDQTVGNPDKRMYVTYDKSSPLVQAFAAVSSYLPNPLFSKDQIEQVCLNDLPKKPNELGWESVGIVPEIFSEKSYNVIFRYKKGGHFRELRIVENTQEGPIHVSHQVGGEIPIANHKN